MCRGKLACEMTTERCPISIQDYPHVLLAHGGGGRLMHQLIDRMFVSAFRNPILEQMGDGAVATLGGTRLAFTTDSYVVRPLFFPGGDIGSMAVHGTVNDLAMCGARPVLMSSAFILEEGLPMETLWRVVQSMAGAARNAGVQLVTGDTKVVDRGKGDGIFINTAGVGVVEHAFDIGPAQVRPGDAILLSGDIGRHGIAVLSVREGLPFASAIESDSAPLASLVMSLLDAGLEIHCMRDLTRGGLGSALVEIAESARVHIAVEEATIAVREDVQGACEILGYDPLYVANEGRFVCFVPAGQTSRALELMRSHPDGVAASIVGSVRDGTRGMVTMTSRLGTRRIVDMLSGEQLPRIC